jgi:hypothetical protein
MSEKKIEIVFTFIIGKSLEYFEQSLRYLRISRLILTFPLKRLKIIDSKSLSLSLNPFLHI